MIDYSCNIELSDLFETRLLAQIVSLLVLEGDIITLRGSIGTGKTTLARHLIRAIAEDNELNVPSPSYPLMINYNTPHFEIYHCDFYRLTDPNEIYDLGFPENLENFVFIIEWPEIAEGIFPNSNIQININDIWSDQPDCRIVNISGIESSAQCIEKIFQIWYFLQSWLSHVQLTINDVSLGYVRRDIFMRRYARLDTPHRSFILMISPNQLDNPPTRYSLTDSPKAYLAEDTDYVTSIQTELSQLGFSVAYMHYINRRQGLAIIEDLGHTMLSDLITQGNDQEHLFRCACDVLVQLSAYSPPKKIIKNGYSHAMPELNSVSMEIEIELLLDWYLPLTNEQPITCNERRSFLDIWRQQLVRLEDQRALVLHEFHSTNLLWLPDRECVARIGIINYQDVAIGHRAYDVVSLLQDTCSYVSQDVEFRLLRYYFDKMHANGRSCNEASFLYAYALLGAQRNIRKIGVVARLAKMSGKSLYLHDIPLLLKYLKRCLEHPALHDIRAWLATYIPHILNETSSVGKLIK
ncbi:MAG: hypothetical protein TECD_00876 [Hyphomicrobiaceae bacterium hypho_1]